MAAGQKDAKALCVSVAHLHIKVFAHSVNSDPMKTAVCQVTRGGIEHIRAPVRLKAIPDLQSPWEESKKKHLKDCTFVLKAGVYVANRGANSVFFCHLLNTYSKDNSFLFFLNSFL